VVITTKRGSDGHGELSVADQGIGIPERDLERIFERFYRVDPARSRATGGTGLGLAIVKHVMAAHNGRVTVRSAEGAGSTFTLFVPLRSEQVGTGAALTREPPETAELNSTGNAQEAPK
jgi:two-component system sensor histidine kinase SenX3